MSRGKRQKETKFRSGLEKVVADLMSASLLKWSHESETLKYTVPETVSRYTPDFKIDKFPKIILETKGIFSSDDRKKTLLVQEQHPDRLLVMLFGRAQNPIRKGSKTTYAAWCDKHEIAWLDLKDFKENPTKCLSTMIKKQRNGKSSSRLKKSSTRSTKSGS